MLSHSLLYARRTLPRTDSSLHQAGADAESVALEFVVARSHLASCLSKPLAIMANWNDQITHP